MVEFGMGMGKGKGKGEASTSNADGILLNKSIMSFTTKNQQQQRRVGANWTGRAAKILKTEDDEMVEAGSSTECSSSFDDSDLSDFHGDVESDLDSDAPVRRKLTSDWKDLAQPIKWRCKWIELQISKLDAQHKKYVRKLEECKRISTLEEGDGREVRRKKRRRDEEAIDTQTYMLNHNVFSYIEKKRRHIREDACQVSKNPVKIDYEFRDDDEVANEDDNDEEEIERLLELIIGMQSRVVEMRNRLSKLPGAQEGQFSRTDNLGSRNSSSSTSDTECGMSRRSLIVSQLISLYYEDADLLPGSTMHGGVGGANCHITCEDHDVLIDNHWVEVPVEIQEQMKIYTKNQRQTPLVLKDESRPLPDPVQVVTNDQAGGGAIDLDKTKSLIRSDEPNRATTSTKTNNKINRRPRRGRCARLH